VLLDAHRQCPRPGELLDTLSPAAQAYINPSRSNEETHTTPGYRPDTISPSLSLWFVDAYIAGEVLDASRATALDCRWTNGRRSWRRSATGSFSARRR
jgi:hypothetical protein